MKTLSNLLLTTIRTGDMIKSPPSSFLDRFPSRGENFVQTVVNMRGTDLTTPSLAMNIDSRPRGLWERVSRHVRAEQGGSLVEFALVLPLLMLIVTGITTFGIALNNYMELTEATGIGAQQLAISRGNTTDPCSTVASAVEGAAPYLTPASLQFTLTLDGTAYGPYAGNTTWSSSTCSSASTSTGAAGNLVQGQSAVLKVTYPCNLAVYGINYAPSCVLSAQVTEIVQ
jgi:Flp pilus assembly protein TadG